MNTPGQPTAKTPIQPSGISDPENELSSNPQFLLEQLRVQKQENQQLQLRLNQLQDQLDLLVRLLYGSKSEKRPPEPTAHEELSLFAESELSAELLAHKQQPQPEVQTKAPKSRERKTGRITFSKDLPTEIVVLKPDCDLEGARLIGTDITTVLVYNPAKYSLKEFHREKYYLPSQDRIVSADAPNLPISKGEADASVLAQITVSKYVDHLPFHRQSKIMARDGIFIAESTMNGWFERVCRLLEILYDHLCRRIVQSNYIQADETGMPVQTREKEGSTHKGFLWDFYSPPLGLLCFIYDKGRGSEVPKNFLKDFSGAMQTDGYTGYTRFLQENADHIKPLACLAHVRRYYDRALDNDPDRANYALTQIGKLYAIEKKAREKGLSPEEIFALRQKEAVPVLSSFKQWLDGNATYLLPQSRIGEAFTYTLKLWDRIMNYTTDGALFIDNNAIENSIRPVALGRRNYMFAGSHKAAQRAAMMYSFFGICKLHGVNPQQWLTDVLNRLPDHSILKLDELLPNNWKPRQQ